MSAEGLCKLGKRSHKHQALSPPAASSGQRCQRQGQAGERCQARDARDRAGLGSGAGRSRMSVLQGGGGGALGTLRLLRV